MTYIEELIESIDYAEENNINWWDMFETIEDAEITLNNCLKENPDEYQIAHLLCLIEDSDFFTDTPISDFQKCIKRLKKQLKRIKIKDQEE